MNMEREKPQYPAEDLAAIEKTAAPAAWLLHAADPAQWAEGGTLQKNLADSLKGFSTGLGLWKPAAYDAEARSNVAENGSVFVDLLLPVGVTLIASRTGGGKTSMLTELAARALLADRPVVFFTGEETAGQLAGKIAVKLQHLTDKTDTHCDTFATECQTTAPDLAAFKNLYIVNSVEDESGLQIVTVAKQICDAWKDIKEPLILIDYAQLLQPPEGGNYSATYEKMKAVAGQLKALGAQGISTVLGAQLNRDWSKDKGEPDDAFWAVMAEQIREAADLEQAAALIVLAWIEADGKKMRLRILKDRNGKQRNAVAVYDIAPKSRTLILSTCENIKKDSKTKQGNAKPEDVYIWDDVTAREGRKK